MGCTIWQTILYHYDDICKNVLGYELTQNEFGTSNDPLTCIVMVAATVFAPAIFEEFAFRCCALGALKKYGKGFAVFMVSIILD